MRDLLNELYFGFLAVLMLSEMFASNLSSVLFQVDNAAAVFGMSVEATWHHMSMLAVLDAIPGLGGVLVVWAIRHDNAWFIGRIGLVMTVTGMLAYGGYQVWFSMLGITTIDIFLRTLGVTYMMFGIVAAWLGRSVPQLAPDTLPAEEQSPA